MWLNRGLKEPGLNDRYVERMLSVNYGYVATIVQRFRET